MMKIEKIMDWGLILITFLAFVRPDPMVEFRVMFLALFVMMLAKLIKNKVVSLSIMGICLLVILFVGIKLSLTL